MGDRFAAASPGGRGSNSSSDNASPPGRFANNPFLDAGATPAVLLHNPFADSFVAPQENNPFASQTLQASKKSSLRDPSSPGAGSRHVRFDDVTKEIPPGAPAEDDEEDPNKVDYVLYHALYDYNSGEEDDLAFSAGDILHVTDEGDGPESWFYGRSQDGKEGSFPGTYVRKPKYQPGMSKVIEVEGGDPQAAPKVAPAAAVVSEAAWLPAPQSTAQPEETPFPFHTSPPKKTDHFGFGFEEAAKKPASVVLPPIQADAFIAQAAVTSSSAKTSSSSARSSVSSSASSSPVKTGMSSSPVKAATSSSPVKAATSSSPVKASSGSSSPIKSAAPAPAPAPAPASSSPPKDTDPDTSSYVLYAALYDYNSGEDGDLVFQANDIIRVTDEGDGPNSWFYGETQDGKEGSFPGTYVRKLNMTRKVVSLAGLEHT